MLVSSALSFISVAGFAAMFLVANELEDPFGQDANDLDILSYHHHFVGECRRIPTRAPRPA